MLNFSGLEKLLNNTMRQFSRVIFKKQPTEIELQILFLKKQINEYLIKNQTPKKQTIMFGPSFAGWRAAAGDRLAP